MGKGSSAMKLTPLVLALGLTACAAPDYADVLADVIPSVVYLTTADSRVCSGVAIRADKVLTNKHCVEGAGAITITTLDSKSFPAEVMGMSDTLDVAVVRIPERKLNVARIGDSDSVRVGDQVTAVGHPHNFTWSVTAGVISAVSRVIPGHGTFIQMDVAINPGNSGGALFNRQGQVIGINTMRRNDAEGISFAIPINAAMDAAWRIIDASHTR